MLSPSILIPHSLTHFVAAFLDEDECAEAADDNYYCRSLTESVHHTIIILGGDAPASTILLSRFSDYLHGIVISDVAPRIQ